jgi:hypothetical protein
MTSGGLQHLHHDVLGETVIRKATPVSAKKPACLGFELDTLSSCSGCVVREKCEEDANYWKLHRSLSEKLWDMRTTLDLSGGNLMELYSRFYTLHFGFPPKITADPPTAKMFRKVAEFCRESKADAAVYISAQMHGLREFLTKSKLRFKINMLSPTEKARKRYNIYLWLARKHGNSAEADVFDWNTNLGTLQHTLVADTVRIARLYCDFQIAGEDIDFDEVAVEMQPSADWRVVYEAYTTDLADREFRLRRGKLVRAVGDKYLKNLKARVDLTSAVTVANSYAPGLADSIGCHEFSWSALARVLTDLYGSSKGKEQQEVDLSDVPGLLWGDYA